MIQVDGGMHSGSGTVVRHAVAFAGLLGRPLHLVNARARRLKPGLRPQHLASVLACAEMCDAEVEGATVGATSFSFVPGRRPRGGHYEWDIGTAGSATMLALSVLPLTAFADGRVTARITGGIYQDFAPSPLHLEHVLAPLLARMGLGARVRVVRPGYVPRGRGELELEVTPAGAPLVPVRLEQRGTTTQVRGIAISSHLEERRVSERMARSCERALASRGLVAEIEARHDAASAQPGAGLAVWAACSGGAILGADCAGALRRRAETIGDETATALAEDLDSGATVDRHAADMLVLFAALAAGESRYLVPRATDHVTTNLWLVGEFGARCALEERRVTIEGLGLAPHA